MHSYVDVTILAGFVVVYGLFSLRLSKTAFTGPILFCLFGWLMGDGGLGFVDLSLGGEAVRVLAELTLVMVLFNDSSRIDIRVLRHNLSAPVRLVGIGLPLTILAGIAVGLLFFPGWDWWSVALIAVILAPTDAALGEAVIDHKEIPVRVRQALNVESGLNDGICVPILTVFMAGALAVSEAQHVSALEVAAKAIGYAVASGIVLGYLGGRLVHWASAAGWMSSTFRRLSMIGLPLGIFTLTQLLGGSGFIAAFISGLMVGNTLKSYDPDQFEAVEDAGDLLSLVTWVVLGGTFVPYAGTYTSWPVVIYALVSLTLVRMVPVALCLLGSRMRWSTVALVGWFGPRGLASIVFAVMVVDQSGIIDRMEIAAVVAWTVFLSIILHGLTASFLANAYGKQCQTLAPNAPELASVGLLRGRRKKEACRPT